MKHIIYSSFGWVSGKYRFGELENPVAEDVAMNLSPVDVILEGIRRIQDPETIQSLLGDLKGLISKPDPPALPLEENALSAQECVILDLAQSRADGSSTVSDLAEISPLSADETLRCLCSLVSVGALELEIPPTAEPAKEAADGSDSAVVTATSNNLPQRLGRYEIQELLGRGSMGAVFLARDPAIERVVAIKLIQTATFLTAREQERFRNRFRREAKAAGKLIHPGIVTVFDVGHADQENPFIVMEYVEGPTLAALTQEKELEVDEWEWKLGAIRVVERTDARNLIVETYEKDILGMGKPKRYRLNLSEPLQPETWSRYQRIAKREALTEESAAPETQNESQPQ